MTLDWIGWQGLTPNEQLAAIGGGVLGAGFPFGMRVLFGGLELRRRSQPGRRIRHRPPARPSPGKRRRPGKGKGRPKGRR